MSRSKILFLSLFVLWLACVEKKTGEVHSTLPIEAAVRHIKLEGYDGLIRFDWDIMNTSGYPIDGWEVKVDIMTTDSLHYNGIFFDYNAPMDVDDTLRFTDYVMFYIDASSVYPVRLRSDAIGIQRFTKQYAWGIITE